MGPSRRVQPAAEIREIRKEYAFCRKMLFPAPKRPIFRERSRSLGFDMGLAYHLGPFFDVAPYQRPYVRRSAFTDLDSLPDE